MKLLWRGLGVGLFGVLVALFIVYAAGRGPGEVPPPSIKFDRLDEAQRAVLAEHGQYVARASDCAACHDSPDGVALAGGAPLETPIGTMYGSNISPSTRYGIGNWSADDLYRALVWGIARDGSQIYPSMPFASYHFMERADVDALWFWLMRQRPIERAAPGHELPFPFNFRAAVAFWNFFFLPDSRSLEPVAERSSAWHRGRYLVDVLGHCGECHTPRNIAYAKTDEHLGGFVIEGFLAPDLTRGGLIARGWNGPDLESFLHRGLSPQGVMTFNMYPVLKHSTQYLRRDDLEAISAYLFDDDIPLVAAQQGQAQPVLADDIGMAGAAGANARPDDLLSGRLLYLGLCAGCHGSQGEGHPHASVALVSNTTAMLEDPRNLVRVLLNGIPARDLAHGERMQEMPGYADRLTAGELAELVNHLRGHWGGQPPDVTASRVHEIASESRVNLRE